MFGKLNSQGDTVYRGLNVYSTNSDGKLAFLGGMIGLSIYVHGGNGTFSGEVYKWE